MDWESAVVDGIEARQNRDDAQWVLGDLALGIETSYGDHNLERYAEAVGVEYNSLRAYRIVAAAYQSDRRISNLSWTHHQVIAGRDDRLDWLRYAKDNRLSVRAMLAEIQKAETEAGVSPFDDGDAEELVDDSPYTDESESTVDLEGLHELEANATAEDTDLDEDAETERLVTAFRRFEEVTDQFFKLTDALPHIRPDRIGEGDRRHMARKLRDLIDTLQTLYDRLNQAREASVA